MVAGRILAIIGLLVAGACSSERISPDEDFLTLHWVADPELLDARICLLASGQPVLVEPEPLMDLTHVSSAKVVAEGSDLFSVVLQLDAVGRAHLRHITTEGVGRQLAIVVDGTVVANPLVVRPIDANELPLMPSTRPLAEELVSRINAEVAERSGEAVSPQKDSRI